MSYNQSPYQEAPPRERPGCVSAYAILLWISGGLYIIGALLLGLAGLMDTEGYSATFLPLAVCVGVVAVIPIIIGWGLWQMKKWAWWLIVIFQGLAILGALSNLLLAFTAEDSTQVASYLCGAILSGAISGLILYWFIQNRQLFDGVTGYQTVMGPGGEPIQQPVVQASTGSGTIALIVGVVAVVLLVPICVIVILALLGPAIGDVYSEIMLSI